MAALSFITTITADDEAVAKALAESVHEEQVAVLNIVAGLGDFNIRVHPLIKCDAQAAVRQLCDDLDAAEFDSPEVSSDDTLDILINHYPQLREIAPKEKA